jgi:hypothetical protein
VYHAVTQIYCVEADGMVARERKGRNRREPGGEDVEEYFYGNWHNVLNRED